MVFSCWRKVSIICLEHDKKQKAQPDRLGFFEGLNLVLVHHQNCLRECGQIPNAVNGNPRAENDTASIARAA